MNQNLKRPEL